MKSRTPRHYSGVQNPAKKISDLLPELVLHLKKRGSFSTQEIQDFWKELLGEKMASLTEIILFENEVLTVKVKSSTLYSLLAVHEKSRLLSKLQEKFSVRNIIFRAG